MIEEKFNYIMSVIGKYMLTGSEVGKNDLELPLFDLVTVTTSTESFSSANVIGEGGFGQVYKVNQL